MSGVATLAIRSAARRNGKTRKRQQPKLNVMGALQLPYASDDADLELRSEDGVIFKVESFYLKAASGVFRSMLTSSAATQRPNDVTSLAQTEASPLPTKQPPIEISTPSLILRLFIDLMHHAPLLADMSPAPQVETSTVPAHFTDLFREANAPVRGREYSIVRLSHLLDLLEQFECGIGMRERALAHFEPYFEVDPWAVFCVAGKYNDIVLGKKAINKFAQILHSQAWKIDPKTMGVEAAARLPLDWLLAYIRAHALSTGQEQTPFLSATFWPRVAENFDTVAPQPPR